MGRQKSQPVIILPLDKWILLTRALEASPDMSIDDLTLKAERLVASRKKYAQEVIRLEGRLLKKCPKMGR